MPWFLVDDQFHSHPKALATEPAALGLWAVAGSWSSEHLTDGLVPDHVLPRLSPDAIKLAEALVATGLWRRVKGGYKVVQGIGLCKIQPKQAVEHERKQAAERQKRRREAQMSRRDRGVTHAVNNGEVRLPDSDTDIPPIPPQTGGGCSRHKRTREGCAECAKGPPAARHPSARTVQQAIDAATKGLP